MAMIIMLKLLSNHKAQKKILILVDIHCTIITMVFISILLLHTHVKVFVSS